VLVLLECADTCVICACAVRTTRPLLAINLPYIKSVRLDAQLIGATDDGKEYDDEDAQLVLDQGTAPRFYIMRLPRRGLTFDRITYHAKVTQCLGEGPTSPAHVVFMRI
jgi:hypothetical protein